MVTTLPNVPGVQINEIQLGPPIIAGVSTSIAAFVGNAPAITGALPTGDQFPNQAIKLTSADQFLKAYVGVGSANPATRSTDLSRAVLGFFSNGGAACYVVNVGSDTPSDVVDGVELLAPIDEIAIIAAPGHTDATVYDALKSQAETLGDRFAILDPPLFDPVPTDFLTQLTTTGAGGVRPGDSEYAAYYYPRILVGPDLVKKGDPTVSDPASEAIPPSGHLAGIYSRVDARRGVHKAPASERIFGALGVVHPLTDADQNALNPEGINLIRVFAGNTIVWGARTLLGASAADTTYRYINVRRLVNFIEESLQEGLRWAVFEPNNFPLRQQITRSARGFLDRVWRDGALFGAEAKEAYYVRFPDAFNTPDDRALGRLTLEIGLAVTYPAEFIIVRIGVATQGLEGV
jgi:phage tail sheath protein FI